ncbi:MAG: RDD family protein [Thermomicrobiales bacterium]
MWRWCDIIYEALLIAYWNGQAIGKEAMGIRVDARGGQPVSVGMAFARSAMKLVSGAVLLLGYLWMLWDPKKQTWHDKVADTYVVQCC